METSDYDADEFRGKIRKDQREENTTYIKPTKRLEGHILPLKQENQIKPSTVAMHLLIQYLYTTILRKGIWLLLHPHQSRDEIDKIILNLQPLRSVEPVVLSCVSIPKGLKHAAW